MQIPLQAVHSEIRKREKGQPRLSLRIPNCRTRLFFENLLDLTHLPFNGAADPLGSPLIMKVGIFLDLSYFLFDRALHFMDLAFDAIMSA